MRAVGLILIALAIYLISAGARGRAIQDLPGDLKDAATAAVTGKWDDVTAALVAPGTLAPPSGIMGGRSSTTLGGGSSQLIAEMRTLGAAARGYRLGSTGPTYYDCSGLTWRAMKNLGIYTGPRFTTATWPAQSKAIATQIDAPVVGCIVVWRKAFGGHMGVATGTDTLYSAMSPRSGIGEAPFASFTKLYGHPKFYGLKETASTAQGGRSSERGV